MQVTIDVSAAVNGKAGLGRYAGTLAAEMAAQQPGHIRLFANRTRQARIPPELAALPLTTVALGYRPWRMAVLAGHLIGLPFDRFLPSHTGVYHATEHLLLPLRGPRTVLTVHDLIYRLFPEHHKKLNYGYLNAAMPVFVRRADHIIAVSESTRRDLIEHYRVPPGKVTVVHEAAAPHFRPQPPDTIAGVRARYGLPDHYLLAVGTIEPRKNLARLVEALAILRRDEPGLRLVVVGAEGWLTGSFHEAIERHGQQEAVIRPGYVPDSDLPAVYAASTISVLASVYEGFGLPVLEAMACGVPVVCSRTSSVGEIAGDAAGLFDPHDLDEMVAALRRVLRDADLQADLRERGLKRAAGFSWERAARETWGVYEHVAARR
jgi:glycosyltransferase involved in cell wall biosynthesis